ncbi:uncharacterized protein PgNI_04976 [Pyricularia grisea]|uniref:Uncharacterized protein n=1 Tax=Pyricularia grisea TaxID=148305 RepID=A0A6P8B9U1_PYRGI|nr:uncharacterized protein PgNI_04976 [Pyricularia grisea]TLD12442.1 hypothetical protein PgNI_04976 [Pyricularia grisea]
MEPRSCQSGWVLGGVRLPASPTLLIDSTYLVGLDGELPYSSLSLRPLENTTLRINVPSKADARPTSRKQCRVPQKMHTHAHVTGIRSPPSYSSSVSGEGFAFEQKRTRRGRQTRLLTSAGNLVSGARCVVSAAAAACWKRGSRSPAARFANPISTRCENAG